MQRKIVFPLFILLFSICISYLLIKSLSANQSPGAVEEQINRTLFDDDFARVDSPDLGESWNEFNEHVSNGSVGSTFLGPGFIELTNGTFAFHYSNHPSKSGVNGQNYRPYAYTTLSSTTSLPVAVTFSISTHSDERVDHIIGLMENDTGFIEVEDGLEIKNYFPQNGISIRLLRSNRNFDNSAIRAVHYDQSGENTLLLSPLPFQFESSDVFTGQLTIDMDLITISMSDGNTTHTDSVSFDPSNLVFDQLFVADQQGGISSLTSGVGDFIVTFDNISVVDSPHLIYLPLVQKDNS